MPGGLNMVFMLNNYVAGKFEEGSGEQFELKDYNNYHTLFLYKNLSYWELERIVENTTSFQRKFGKVSLDKIKLILKETFENLFNSEKELEYLIQLSGSNKFFLEKVLEEMKLWVRNIDKFEKEVFIGLNSNQIRNSSPVFLLLPNNSEQSFFYVIVQILLSRNVSVVRPSSSGAGLFLLNHFMKKFNLAIDKFGGEDSEILRNVISVICSDKEDYFSQLSISSWNYIFFGSNSTLDSISSTLKNLCDPRKIISYGTGFSFSVVSKDVDLKKTASLVLESVLVNAGVECDSTDMLYLHGDIHDNFLDELQSISKKFINGNLFSKNSFGVIKEKNLNYILNTLKISKLKYDIPFIAKLSKFDTFQEFPGPVIGIRKFNEINELVDLMDFDLNSNKLDKNLTTSVFCKNDLFFDKLLPNLRSYNIKKNKPTHKFNFFTPHQGVFILRELVEIVYLD